VPRGRLPRSSPKQQLVPERAQIWALRMQIRSWNSHYAAAGFFSCRTGQDRAVAEAPNRPWQLAATHISHSPIPSTLQQCTCSICTPAQLYTPQHRSIHPAEYLLLPFHTPPADPCLLLSRPFSPCAIYVLVLACPIPPVCSAARRAAGVA